MRIGSGLSDEGKRRGSHLPPEAWRAWGACFDSALDRGQATALASFVIDHLPTEPGFHASAEAEIADPLDPADASGIVHCHYEQFRFLEKVLGRFCTESGSVALHPSEDHFPLML